MKTESLDIILAFALVFVVTAGFSQTWQQVPPFQGFGGPETNYYGSIGMSADGKIICAFPEVNYPVISTNSGTTWIRSTNTGNWSSSHLGGTAVSADGLRIYDTMANPAVDWHEIQVTTNVGANWGSVAFPIAKIPGAQVVACSANGTKVIAAWMNSQVFYSTNGGANYATSSVSPANWISLASSAEGGRMVAAASGGSIYFSEDYGATWTPANLSADAWNGVCTSAMANGSERHRTRILTSPQIPASPG